MNDSWIGRRLKQASPALNARFVEDRSTGPAAQPLGAMGEELLYQIGGLIQSEADDVTAPLARTRGILRLPQTLRLQDTALAFNRLGKLLSDYLLNLPGISAATERKARGAIQHAGATTLRLQAALLHDEPDPSLLSAFGGAVVVTYPRGARTPDRRLNSKRLRFTFGL